MPLPRTQGVTHASVTTVAEPFLDAESWAVISRALGLSPREAQIASLMLADETEDAIATRLGISAHTVHTHVERLFRKLCVSSRCQVIVRIFQEYVGLSSRAGALGESSAHGAAHGSRAD
jgi:DNA-binding NarL/FixJ family response regulator